MARNRDGNEGKQETATDVSSESHGVCGFSSVGWTRCSTLWSAGLRCWKRKEGKQEDGDGMGWDHRPGARPWSEWHRHLCALPSPIGPRLYFWPI